FAQFRRQAQILSLEILNVFLHLKFSPSLNLNKIEHFSKVSLLEPKLKCFQILNKKEVNTKKNKLVQVKYELIVTSFRRKPESRIIARA
ncbi:MAG: hypothetical protein KKD50_10045, partial [Proteobacteria bacterium]|nr:hypothetical protein [Pseudomonadota bacterium]